LIPDDLAGSDIFDDLFASVQSNHANREPSPQQETKARRSDSTDAVIKALLLNSRDGDISDDFIATVKPNRASTREPSPQQETQARRALDELD
jgi:hypothetical protein